MRQAIIHIGISKTGSTSIQKAFHGSRQTLFDNCGLLYPALAANLSLYLSMVFKEKMPPTLPALDRRARRVANHPLLKREYLGQIEKDLERPGWQQVLISGEGLSGFSDKNVLTFRDWIFRHVDSAKVIVFVRHPVSWTRSVTQERLNSGHTLAAQFADPGRCNWRRCIEPWITHFGFENVQILSFEEACRTGLIARFCQAAGLDRDAVLPVLELGIASNEAMTREAAYILNAMNSLFGSTEQYMGSRMRRLAARAIIRSVGGKKFSLPKDVEQKAFEQARDDVRWLHETFSVNWYDDLLNVKT